LRHALKDIGGKTAVRLSDEAINVLFFLEHMCLVGFITRAMVYEAVPAYIFDSVK
jgi:hypothetical protein